MSVTERVMGLGDWSLRLRGDTPTSVRDAISTPFTQLVVTPGRVPASTTSDASMLALATYVGVVLRPGPQLDLAGCGQAWYLGDADGGAGYLASGKSFATGSLSGAVSSLLTGTAFTSGTIGGGTINLWDTGPTTIRAILDGLAGQLGMEWRIRPDRKVDVADVAAIYGANPTGVIIRNDGPQQLSTPWGLTGNVSSSWDWETYGSKVLVRTNQAMGTAGGASTYRDPAGTAMTITRNFEAAEIPLGAENGYASSILSQINRKVRTVEVDTTTYSVTGYVPCGGQVWLYDVDQKLYDFTNKVQYAGQTIYPVNARIVSITWPIERGMGVYVRSHDGTSASYVDLTDWVEWEGPGARMEVSTGAQVLSPPQPQPIQNLWRPWQWFVPTWVTDNVQPAIGNGTLEGRYRMQGTSMELVMRMVAGSTTTFGVGRWVFYLPNSRGGAGTMNQLGQVACITAAGVVYPGKCYVEPGFGNVWCVDDNSPWGAVTNANPFAWGNGAQIIVNITLEVGP